MNALSRRDFLGAAAMAVLGGWASRGFAAQAALKAPVALVDAEMLDVRRGRKVRLVRDVMGDRVVAVNFFFTGCSTICPVQAMAFTRAQAQLASELGTRAAFVSISIDWFGDTEQAIRKFAKAHRAGNDWHFLKAPTEVVEDVRRGFDSYAPRRDDHPPVVAVGRADAKQWSRLYGLPSGDVIAQEVQEWLS